VRDEAFARHEFATAARAQRAHKCTDDILDFVGRWRMEHEAAPWPSVAAAVRHRFDVTIHPRSLARALARWEKKRRPPGATRT
jgi:hypothetical protein